MLFNSFEFALFLPIAFLLYWFVFDKKLKGQNLFLLIISYVFYGWWDWRFLLLIALSSTIDFIAGIKIEQSTVSYQRKIWLGFSVFINLGMLFFFKYYNFFLASLISSFSSLGINLNISSLNLILPVGISFYTFQTLSYTIDIYNKKLLATKDPIGFFAFVSFFPQLVAGPIERASDLLPQFFKKRTFSLYLAKDGLRQILWGLFKKIVIADNVSGYVDYIFHNYTDLPSSTLWIGAFYFAIQIYCDFSGYSDIAIGTSKLFGFSLKTNFAYPYFSRDIAEFWRRWHISLSSWFRDYLYIPLGGSRCKPSKQVRNVLIIFLVSGLWHGANWTFIVWGLLNGLYFLPLFLLNKNRNNTDSISRDSFIPNYRDILGITSTFLITTVAWVFFRASDLNEAISYIGGMFNASILEFPIKAGMTKNFPFIFLMFLIEWCNRTNEFGLSLEGVKYTWLRWLVYYVLILMIIVAGGDQQGFIYFQF